MDEPSQMSPTPMPPAPELPRESDTPAYSPPPETAAVTAPALRPQGLPPRPRLRPARAERSGLNLRAGAGPAERIFSNAAAAHGAFLSACGDLQSSYLSVMAAATSQLASGANASPATEAPPPPPLQTLQGDAALSQWMRVDGDELWVDLSTAPWLADHCPDYGAAVVPMMGVVEIVGASAQAARPGLKVTNVKNLRLARWIVVGEAPLRIRREVKVREDGVVEVTLYIWRRAKRAELSRDEAVARAEVVMGEAYPDPPPVSPPLIEERVSPHPYDSGSMFHGPAFQLLSNLSSGLNGAGGDLSFDSPAGVNGALHPIALDAALHTGADRRWAEWCPGLESEAGSCLPLRIDDLAFYGPTPTGGRGRAEMRCPGLAENSRLARYHIEVSTQDQVWAVIDMTLVAPPPGPMDAYSPLIRRQFLRDRVYLPDVHISTFAGEATILTDATVASANWVPATVETAYNIPPDTDVTKLVAQKEHAARILNVHPGVIDIEGDMARAAERPGTVVKAIASREKRRVTVMSV